MHKRDCTTRTTRLRNPLLYSTHVYGFVEWKVGEIRIDIKTDDELMSGMKTHVNKTKGICKNRGKKQLRNLLQPFLYYKAVDKLSAKMSTVCKLILTETDYFSKVRAPYSVVHLC